MTDEHWLKKGLNVIMVCIYLIVQPLDVRNIHVVGGGTDIFIFLSSKYVNSNHVHLKRKLSLSIYAVWSDIRPSMVTHTRK